MLVPKDVVAKELLLAVAPSCKKPDDVVMALNKWLPSFRIDTPKRIACFLSQFSHESADFNSLAENTNYIRADRLFAIFPKDFKSVEEALPYVGKPQAIANRVYANQNGNGNEASGDGYKYRGRGICGLTGLGNYKEANAALAGSVGNLIDHPEILETIDAAVLIGCWYWGKKNFNILADADKFDKMTLILNGGQNGREDRMARLVKARRSLGI